MTDQKKSSGTKKYGRDATKCARYRSAGTREKNKEKRILKEKKRQARLKARKGV